MVRDSRAETYQNSHLCCARVTTPAGKKASAIARLPLQKAAPSLTHLGLRAALQLPQPLLLLTQLHLCHCRAHATHLSCQPCHLSILHIAHLQQSSGFELPAHMMHLQQ